MPARRESDRPFGRDHERRQWSRWDNVPEPRARADGPREENAPGAVDALIAAFAAAFATPDDRRRDPKGRWAVGGRSKPDRDVALYLTREAYGLTKREVASMFGLLSRASASRALRRGRKLVESRRAELDPRPGPGRHSGKPPW